MNVTFALMTFMGKALLSGAVHIWDALLNSGTLAKIVRHAGCFHHPCAISSYEAVDRINKQFGTKINLTECIQFNL
jgi:hypothetical protein